MSMSYLSYPPVQLLSIQLTRLEAVQGPSFGPGPTHFNLPPSFGTTEFPTPFARRPKSTTPGSLLFFLLVPAEFPFNFFLTFSINLLLSRNLDKRRDPKPNGTPQTIDAIQQKREDSQQCFILKNRIIIDIPLVQPAGWYFFCNIYMQYRINLK